jgi:hypothetical protein
MRPIISSGSTQQFMRFPSLSLFRTRKTHKSFLPVAPRRSAQWRPVTGCSSSMFYRDLDRRNRPAPGSPTAGRLCGRPRGLDCSHPIAQAPAPSLGPKGIHPDHGPDWREGRSPARGCGERGILAYPPARRKGGSHGPAAGATAGYRTQQRPVVRERVNERQYWWPQQRRTVCSQAVREERDRAPGGEEPATNPRMSSAPGERKRSRPGV